MRGPRRVNSGHHDSCRQLQQEASEKADCFNVCNDDSQRTLKMHCALMILSFAEIPIPFGERRTYLDNGYID